MPRTGLLIAVALVLALLAVFLATTDLWRVERVERAPDEHHGTEASKATETERAEAAKGESKALSPSVDLDTVDTDRDLHGTVVEKDGPPIAGAELVVVRYPGRRTTTLDMDRFYLALEGERTRSAGDGTFSVRLRRGDSVSLRVRADGFAPMELPYLQAGERVKVEMVPGVTLVVTSLDEEKRPVPDVEIRMFRIGRPGDTTIDR